MSISAKRLQETNDRKRAKKDLQEKFDFLLNDCPSASFKYWLNDLNDFLLEKNLSGITGARELSRSEILSIEQSLLAVDIVGSKQVIDEFRNDFREILRGIGVEDDLSPD